MPRIAVTDGMDQRAVQSLRDAGHDVTEQHFTREELLDGALLNYDAVVVRSATKMREDIIAQSKIHWQRRSRCR